MHCRLPSKTKLTLGKTVMTNYREKMVKVLLLVACNCKIVSVPLVSLEIVLYSVLVDAADEKLERMFSPCFLTL